MVSLNPAIYVKIICHCGQKYAFDVYPVNKQMPLPVKCPVCHADGTAAANEILAQKLTGTTAPPVPPAPKVQRAPPVVKVLSIYDVPSVPYVPAVANVPGVTNANAANEEWRRRALEAELRAEQAQAALKAGLAPQLAQSLKDAVVQGLAAQRSELLKVQQIAVLEISELVRRLDELKAPLQERLHSYEARIRELEKDLAERNEENRELLKLKIEMIRSQLEAERAGNRVNFN
ncbi:MAG: hypothetical protein ACREDS_05155 [Limisphaerales bacterium]